MCMACYVSHNGHLNHHTVLLSCPCLFYPDRRARGVWAVGYACKKAWQACSGGIHACPLLLFMIVRERQEEREGGSDNHRRVGKGGE